MEGYICNKCYATVNRGKQPFCLTQCGHIYCQLCIQAVIAKVKTILNSDLYHDLRVTLTPKNKSEKQCPQCQNVDSFSVELQQPSLSRVQNFFKPIKEGLESLNTIFGFQDNQIKIVTQRFLELDKKYESLKAHYYTLSQSTKYFKDKCNKIKMENVELRKKLMSMEVHNRTMNSMNDTSTPINSPNRKFKTRHTASTYASTGRTNLSSTCKMFDGFRIPNTQSAKSHNSRDTSDTNSVYTFRR